MKKLLLLMLSVFGLFLSSVVTAKAEVITIYSYHWPIQPSGCDYRIF